MENRLFQIIANNKDYKLFLAIKDLVKDEVFKAEKSMAISMDNDLTILMNIVNNAGWDKKETHTQTIDIIRKASEKYDIFLEEINR